MERSPRNITLLTLLSSRCSENFLSHFRGMFSELIILYSPFLLLNFQGFAVLPFLVQEMLSAGNLPLLGSVKVFSFFLEHLKTQVKW